MRNVQTGTQSRASTGMNGVTRHGSSAGCWHRKHRVDALAKLLHRFPQQFLT